MPWLGRTRLVAVVVAGFFGLGAGVPEEPMDERPISSVAASRTPEKAEIVRLESLSAKLERRVKVLERKLKAAKRRDRLRDRCLVPRSLIEAGHCLQSAGLRVSEHPAFGGVEPVHSGEAHYEGRAFDVNAAPGTSSYEQARLDPVSDWLRRAGFKVIWRSAGHFNHLHAETGS